MNDGAGAVRIRQSPRVPFESTARLGVNDWEDGSSYRTENLFCGGVMLRGARPLVEVRPVRFRFNSSEATLQGEGTVAWVRRAPSAGDEDYLIGFTFLKVSEGSTEALEGLLSGREAPRAGVEAPLLGPPPQAFLNSLQVADRRRRGEGGQGQPAPFDGVEPRPVPLAQKEEPGGVLEQGQAAGVAGAARIESVEIVDLPSGTGIRVRADGPLAESALSTLVLGGDSPRFIVRIAGLEGPLDKGLPSLRTSEAHGIRAGWHETERGGEVHLAFDMTSSDVAATAAVSADGILVRLDRTD